MVNLRPPIIFQQLLSELSQNCQTGKLQRQGVLVVEQERIAVKETSLTMRQAHSVPKDSHHSGVQTVKVTKRAQQLCDIKVGNCECRWCCPNLYLDSIKINRQGNPSTFHRVLGVWPLQRVIIILLSPSRSIELLTTLNGRRSKQLRHITGETSRFHGQMDLPQEPALGHCVAVQPLEITQTLIT